MKLAGLPDACRYQVGAWTGELDVSVFGPGEIESLISSFRLSVVAGTGVKADPFLR